LAALATGHEGLRRSARELRLTGLRGGAEKTFDPTKEAGGLLRGRLT
jgi:hypothetical protein